MTEIRKALLSCIAALLLLTAAAPPAGAEPDHKTVFDFTGYRGGPVLTWLAQQGFTAKQDATSASKVQFSIVGDDLILEAKHNALGLLLTEANLTGFARIRITWGVEAFPEGASYEKGVRSDAAMVYVFFGDEKIASGSMMVPNSPYFIGLFLCQTDPVGRAYQGRYFKAGGRYVCADQTKTGETVTTEFPIDDAFKRFFGLSKTPYISGLGIAIDTDSAMGEGTARSFIREIEFLR